MSKFSSLGMVASLMLSASLLCVSACSNIRQANPISVACQATQGQKVDVEICAFATYGTFVVFEEQALKVARDLKQRANAATNDEIKKTFNKAVDAIAAADAKAKPIADKMNSALSELLKIKSELTAGATSDEKILIATENLRRWVLEASPLIQDLVATVKGKGSK